MPFNRKILTFRLPPCCNYGLYSTLKDNLKHTRLTFKLDLSLDSVIIF